ncbi:MAG: hypothetical protein PHE27_06455, partial [Alphaproteobacteria bacterium]|nr:hypothetical protein [Alphaproteobacteria bacterium]
EDIGRIIEEINAVSSNIASAVTQQTAATREIAMNIQHVSSSAAQTSDNIALMTKDSEISLHDSKEVLTAAGHLSDQSKKLQKEVENFLTHLRKS